VTRSRWQWRATVALLGVAVAFVIYPLTEGSSDIINSDWTPFATGARLILTDPAHLYDLDKQKQVQSGVTGGKTLVTLGINGILPFLAPAWVSLVAAPFELLGTELGGRLWILFGLACLAIGLYLATRPRPPTAVLPAFASVPTAIMMLNAQLDGIVALGIGAAIALWSRPYLRARARPHAHEAAAGAAARRRDAREPAMASSRRLGHGRGGSLGVGSCAQPTVGAGLAGADGHHDHAGQPRGRSTASRHAPGDRRANLRGRGADAGGNRRRPSFGLEKQG
jgi:hypothetical protein